MYVPMNFLMIYQSSNFIYLKMLRYPTNDSLRDVHLRADLSHKVWRDSHTKKLCSHAGWVAIHLSIWYLRLLRRMSLKCAICRQSYILRPNWSMMPAFHVVKSPFSIWLRASDTSLR